MRSDQPRWLAVWARCGGAGHPHPRDRKQRRTWPGGLQGGEEVLAVDPQQRGFPKDSYRRRTPDAVQQPDLADVTGAVTGGSSRDAGSPPVADTRVAPARIHSTSASSPSRITTPPAGMTTSSAAAASRSSVLRSASASRSSSDSSSTHGRSRPAAAAEARSARSKVGRPISPRAGMPTPTATSATSTSVCASRMPVPRLANQMPASSTVLEVPEHPAEHCAGQIALQPGERKHVHNGPSRLRRPPARGGQGRPVHHDGRQEPHSLRRRCSP